MQLPSATQNSFSAQSDIPRSLWRWGGLVAIFLITIFIGNYFVPSNNAVTWDMLGHDFLALYYGGNCARTGHYEQLYDLPATKNFEFNTGHAAKLSLGSSFGPWWNPPFAAWLFAPFSALPYLTALHAWWLLSALCLALSALLMATMIRGSWKIRLLIPLLLLTSKPCFLAICHGQNTFVSLLFLTAAVWFWRRGFPFFAGVVCGLLFYKPQLGAVVAVVLCLSQGRRAILGVCLTGTVLALANVLLMPGTLHEFAHQMPLNLAWIQEQNKYRWERHVTLMAFWRALFQGDAIGKTSSATRFAWIATEIILLAALARVLIRSIVNRGPRAWRCDRLIAPAIIAMPLLMPFYFDYDLLLVSVGIVAYVADRQNSNVEYPEDRWIFRLWTATFLSMWLWFLVLIPWHTMFTPTVPLLAILAALHIRRALRPAEAASAAQSLFDHPPAIAA